MSTLLEKLKNLKPTKDLAYYIRSGERPSLTDRFNQKNYQQIGEDEELKTDISELKTQGKSLEDILSAIDETDVDKEKAKQIAYKFFEQEIRTPKMPTPIQPSAEDKEAIGKFMGGAKKLGKAIPGFAKEQFQKSQRAYEELTPEFGGRKVDVMGFAAPLKVGQQAQRLFKGLKNISTKLLEKFRGMPEEITPQQFNEVINKAQKEGIRKADLDLIKEMAERQIKITKPIENSKLGNFWIKEETGEIMISSMGNDTKQRWWKETPERKFEIT